MPDKHHLLQASIVFHNLSQLAFSETASLLTVYNYQLIAMNLCLAESRICKEYLARLTNYSKKTGMIHEIIELNGFW
jgi:hypothetical protein